MIPHINQEVKLSGYFVMPKTKVTCNGCKEYLSVFASRIQQIRGCETIDFVYTTQKDALLEVHIDSDMQMPGAYYLNITTDKVIICSADTEGIASALTTLYWKLRKGEGSCSCEEVTDAPKFSHRGLHLDCSRHFFGVQTVKKILEQCALRKLNRLHWHLSDDQGFRIESEKFPLLNEIGSWRTEMDGSRHGGYYTKNEIREIILYAKHRGIEIIPEIDLPGHVSSMIAAYPELSCSGESLVIPNSFGIHDRVLCVGKSSVLKWVYELLDEVCDLFPYTQIHIGGDEIPRAEWEKCPCCQSKMRELGFEKEDQLQTWFTGQILDHLSKTGRTGICWNDVFRDSSFDRTNCVIQYWDEEGQTYCDHAILGNYKWIYSYAPALYLDFIPAMVPMRGIKMLDRKLRCGAILPADSVLGYEAALWTEQYSTEAELEFQLFPRILAMAELAWSGNADISDVQYQEEIEWLIADGIQTMPLDQADPTGDAQINCIVDKWTPVIQLMRIYGMGHMETVIYAMLHGKLSEFYNASEIEQIIVQIKQSANT